MNLRRHSQLSDREFVKTVFSAGDYFPGTYRYTLGRQRQSHRALTLAGVMRVLAGDGAYTRQQWLAEAERYYQETVREDQAYADVVIQQLVGAPYLDWLLGATHYDLLCLDAEAATPVLQPGESYLFMGCVVRYGNDQVELGVDHHQGRALLTLDYPTAELDAWLNRIYRDSHQDLFLPARVLASLTFSDDVGALAVSEAALMDCLGFTRPLLYASNGDRARALPVRWARAIALTEVAP